MRTFIQPAVAVLLLAAILRLWQFGSSPILYFDSGAYLGEGRFLSDAAARAANAWLHPEPGAADNPVSRVVQSVATGTAGHSPDLAKPGHAILLALAMLALGPTTLAAGSVPALAGLGTVAATYALGRTGWNRQVGLVAAFLLAISAEHLVYSREPLVESTGLLFSTLASLVYLRQILRPNGGSRRGLLAAGVLFGVSFTCNNRISYLPLSIGIVELVLWRKRGWRSWRPVLPRAAVLVVGFLLPVVIGDTRVFGAERG